MIPRKYTAEDYSLFTRSLQAIASLPLPKRITVTVAGQEMLNAYKQEFKGRYPEGFLSIPVNLVDDQFSPYVQHNS